MRMLHVVGLLMSGVLFAQQPELRVHAGPVASTETLLELPEGTPAASVWKAGTLRAHGQVLPACAPLHPRATAVLLLSASAAGTELRLRGDMGPDLWPSGTEAPPLWTEERVAEERLLRFGGRCFLRTVTAFDTARAEDTQKPWQDLFATDGVLQITKGSGGKYPHHRGVFLGWNKVEHAGLTHDFWHCRGGVSIRHRRFIDAGAAAGRVAARLIAEQEWCLADGKPVVRETRSLTAFAGASFRALDVSIALQALEGPVKLGGDAHHAGFHVRAADAVTATEKETAIWLPSGARTLGNDIHADLAWGAMSFKLDGRSFTLLLIEHPANPAGAVLSARPYGRFGFMPLATLDPAKPLCMRWRLLVFEGAVLAITELARHAETFRAPPRVDIVR